MNDTARPPDPRPAPTPRVTRRWRRRLADEREEAAVYRALASRRDGVEREILLGLATAEERHIRHWENLLGPDPGHVRRGALRTRTLAWLARRFGSVFVLALAQRAESRSPYGEEPDATPAMAADERIHEEVVRGLAARGLAGVSGRFRAAVFGANDGLVSNLALVLGVTGGGATGSTVLLTGLAGLLAGALSMGAGEYVSVRSQRELIAATTASGDTGRAVPHLDVEANELALVYRARGLTPEQADERAAVMLRGHELDGADAADPQDAADVVGTGLGAALSSSACFALGAAVPVLPFLVGLTDGAAVVVAVVLVALALMVTGAVVGVLSGGPALRRALRQLAIGMGAAAVTYVVGTVLGATVG